MVTPTALVAGEVLAATLHVGLVVSLTRSIVLVLNLDFMVNPVLFLTEVADRCELQIFRSYHSLDVHVFALGPLGAESDQIVDAHLSSGHIGSVFCIIRMVIATLIVSYLTEPSFIVRTNLLFLLRAEGG